MDLPDFDDSTRALESRLDMDEMAECHGLLCGLLCAYPNLKFEQFKVACIARELPAKFDSEVSTVLQVLLHSSRTQLSEPEMSVGLWLPDDDELLQVRTAALATWCSGYLMGLTEGCGPGLMEVSDDLSEIVTDIGEISRANVSTDGEDEIEENSYAEIVEFVRVAVLLVQEELKGPREDDSVH